VFQNKISISTDEKRYDELGRVTYFGTVYKKRGDLNKFHGRWIVLRGFDIYWFREAMGLCKGKATLPSLPVATHKFEQKECFIV